MNLCLGMSFLDKAQLSDHQMSYLQVDTTLWISNFTFHWLSNSIPQFKIYKGFKRIWRPFLFPEALLIYLQDQSKCGIFQRSISIQTLDMLQGSHEAEKETLGHVTLDMGHNTLTHSSEENKRYKQVWSVEKTLTNQNFVLYFRIWAMKSTLCYQPCPAAPIRISLCSHNTFCKSICEYWNTLS